MDGQNRRDARPPTTPQVFRAPQEWSAGEWLCIIVSPIFYPAFRFWQEGREENYATHVPPITGFRVYKDGRVKKLAMTRPRLICIGFRVR
ncbi:hypothetical protein AVEN_107530-1 [Araneus ventricosus]|uniref:Uncharacterized protein n=1 Tax=Araneus ventricosus TaxID=182803 RepID=A0A4Y2X6N9_ARAVE|nr:hypothetical protein AVEN_107530-1 [Araneus ventricosus]